jgi:hypothetical protein
MTAVVGILNKQAIAIAADSAVTIGGVNGKKIFNRANKVFTLSKYNPVGVMLYNSGSFMATPWETIIKVYRKALGEGSFPTVEGYQEDFIKFLRDKDFYTNENEQKVFLKAFSNCVIDAMLKEVVNENKALVDSPTEENRALVLTKIETKVDAYIVQFDKQELFCNDFLDFTRAEFNEIFVDFLDELVTANFTVHGYNIGDELKDKLTNLLYIYLKVKEIFTNFTGLIFVGFGEDEIYPALIPVNISLSWRKRLRFYVDTTTCTKITSDNNGAIRPFAQTDVIDTILSGIDPKLDDIYMKNFEAYFTKYNNEILGILGDTNPELTAQISSLDIKELSKEYAQKNLETKQSNYLRPLMNAVSGLSKEDLAEMAESLIYLTYLKRRITFAEESVGGPVDVAIISKGDGFIWIKRKHYFKPELNQFFIDNYFNI